MDSWYNLARQLNCKDFDTEISLIHFANLHWNTVSVSLGAFHSAAKSKKQLLLAAPPQKPQKIKNVNRK